MTSRHSVSILEQLNTIVGEVFAADNLPEALGQVTVSDRPDLGHFQCNGAMAAAKIAKKAPRQIAERIVDQLKQKPIFIDVSVAGPGFINLSLTNRYLSDCANTIASNERHADDLGKKQSIVIDFGGPNIAKPMHVGHLRSSIIGDCLQRVSRFLGHDVISDIHMGDWGKPIGMLITELELEQPDLPYFKADAEGPFPNDPPVTMADLERLYPQAAAACKADADRDEAARLATAALQEGRPGYRALWQHFFNVSRIGMEREFSALGIRFDLWKGESDVDSLVPKLVEDLSAQSIVELSDGAQIIRVDEETDSHEIPPLILVKTDGGQTYATTDLATIADRVQNYDPNLILYVVDQRQATHFEQVFRAARKAKLNGHADLEHIGFGTMNGPDGKPFKTRAGGVMKLHDLIEQMRAKALERLEEAGLAKDAADAEKQAIASQIGVAALKFADLSNHRLSNYIFDIDRFMRFEGKTGPYLQYAAVRIKSLFAKAADTVDLTGPFEIQVQAPLESALVLRLAQLPEVLAATFDKRAPNILCDHVYTLAQDFSRFYTEHHILSEEDEAIKRSRLGLAQATLAQFEQCLDLLGISIPDQM